MIKYKKGDLFKNIDDNEPTILVHVCNDIGKWGKGFVVALSKYNRLPETAFRGNYYNKQSNDLGDIQLVMAKSNLMVVNMIAQKGIGKDREGNPPIRYNYLEKCLEEVSEIALETPNVKVIMPKIGAGLAGGDWNRIEAIINKTLTTKGIEVEVFEL